MLKVLFATSEMFPLIKTGGLADVSGSLPVALGHLGHDVRVIMPAYSAALAGAGAWTEVARSTLLGHEVSLLEARLEGGLSVWLLRCPELYERPGGGPYVDAAGAPWPDNAVRFGVFCRAVVELAMGRMGLAWRPDLVHGNDWQTGLVPALLSQETARPATVFTIHNLAYQGVFPPADLQPLALPDTLTHYDGLEFYGELSFIKGGLVYADRINTVSPTYAQEIQTADFGCGLDGLLRHRSARLSGILNGLDLQAWNPAADPNLVQRYNKLKLEGKQANKAALQGEFGLPMQPEAPLIGMVGRLVEQKGIDLVLAAGDELVRSGVQLVVLGTGQEEYEDGLRALARKAPQHVAVYIGYDEGMAHRIEAGSDMFLMPSRFEPCGLNQMYSQRYGTIPIVHQVGGLADTVIGADAETLEQGRATGVSFAPATAAALMDAVRKALVLFRDKAVWKWVQLTCMRQDFSWARSAKQYAALYEQALRDQG